MCLKMKCVVFFLVVGLIGPWSVQADWKPTKTIKVYVGFGAGGGVDTFARVITNEISKNSGWNFTVFNQPGGGGSVAAKNLKKEKADGYAIALSPSEVFTFNPTINPKIGFDINDFSYIAAVSRSQGALVCLPDKPWKTFKDAVDAAKSGQKISVAYLTPKIGMAMKAVHKIMGVEFVLVPVKGGAAGMKNLLGKHVDISWGAGLQGKYVKTGQVKILAAAEKERIAMAPDAPTMPELGVKYAVLNAIFTFAGPKNMPKDIMSAFAKEIKKAVETEKIKDLVSQKMSMQAIFITGEELHQAMEQSLVDAKELVAFVKQ